MGNEFVCLAALAREGSVSGAEQLEKYGRQDRIVELGWDGPTSLLPRLEGRYAAERQVACGLLVEGEIWAQYLKRRAFLFAFYHDRPHF
jgi:hypothetical protein